ncbi:MAG: NAD-dependent protein deacylase [Candidatus Omnitrophota bacterium]
MEKEKIAQVVDQLKKSKSILFITGAGMSADSGLPTYRGIGGLYNDKVTEDGMPIETALAGETLRSQPEITWKYLGRIEENCRNAKFNKGHQVIAQMGKHFERVWVLTQNIDGFHRAAGSERVIDIHGDFHDIYCPECDWRITVTDYSQIGIPPYCPNCKKIARPDVVFFGEMLSQDKVDMLYRELDRGFDMYFSIGTTSVFPYIIQPMIVANHLGRFTVEINPGDTEISDLVDVKVSLNAAEALDMVWQKYLSIV